MRAAAIVAAFSDAHGPEFLHYLRGSLDALSQATIVLAAGDIVDGGNTSHGRLVIDVVRMAYKGQLFAVFGNEEYDDIEAELRRVCPDVTWLKDEAAYLEVKGLVISIIGTRGSLDKPTRWQQRNIPNARAVYAERIMTLDRLLAEAKRKAHYTILLTHYAPICPTLEGEPAKIWSQMGSRRLTELILRHGPDLVIHGHAHRSTKPHVRLGRTEVYNVALPAIKRVTLIEVTAHRGLEAFF